MVSIDEDLDKITKMQTLLEASEWNLGPDELMPANSYYSCELATPVLLKSKENRGFDANILFYLDECFIPVNYFQK